MANIEELLRKRKEILEEIDQEILKSFSRSITLLFTDLVGSTEYFEKMGDIAGRQLIQIHNDLLFPVIEAHQGRVIKTIGDSIMATYDDPLLGVKSAVAMQEALRDHNRARVESQKLKVRMGLHFGKAVVDEKDLFGDMVNLSARIVSRASGEEILISGALNMQIKSAGIALVALGSESMKGKEESVELLLVNWKGKDEEEILTDWKSRSGHAKTVENAPGRRQRVDFLPGFSLRKEAETVKPISNKGNPYLSRVMIPHPDLFFGRKGLVARIMGRISSENPQSVSIVGERRIGKSSLLNFLRFPKTRLASLEDPDRYVFLFMDFQQLRSIDTGQFYSLVFAELGKQLAGRMELELSPDFDGMCFFCDRIASAGCKFIFLFDEFECVTKNEKIGPEFYSLLRSLANNYPVGFLISSGRNLKDMCVSHQISDSPFFNIFSIQHVGLFTTEEAMKLIAEPSRERGIPLEPVADQILSLGGLYPFFLQIACSSWYEHLQAEGRRAEEFKEGLTPKGVIDLFREEATPHFEFILESCLPEEKAAFTSVIDGASGKHREASPDALERKGYLVKTEEGLAPFSKEFAHFLENDLAKEKSRPKKHTGKR